MELKKYDLAYSKSGAINVRARYTDCVWKFNSNIHLSITFFKNKLFY